MLRLTLFNKKTNMIVMARKRKNKPNPFIFIILSLAVLALVLFYMQSSRELSELQVVACSAADAASTCDSRLAEVGIVLKEECCQALGKCCS